MNRKGTALATCLAALLASLAPAAPPAGARAKAVGIAMPTQSAQRWIQDGANMKSILEARGYRVDLQYAEDDIGAQVSQIENMITKGDAVLVIASIDGESLTNVLEKAHTARIPVIAYDRLIRNSPYVDYYATFDNFKVGVLQGDYIVDKLRLNLAKGSFNLEIFAGSPDDNNAGYFFRGAMSRLKPYIESGKLFVRSGQTDFQKVAILRWDGAAAQKRMDDILTSKYTSARVDAVLSPYDGLSIGILSSLKSAGYGGPRKPLPVVTGQDAELASVKSILAGEQTQTVFKDTRVLARRAADMVDALLSGRPAEVNDTRTYDNGSKVVASYLCDPVSIDATSYEAALIGSGYYTAAQLGR
jgi:putative multiple sugar transport system substrate-binding protein